MFKFILPTFNFNIERWKWNKEYRVYVSNMGHFRDEHKRLIEVKISGTDGYVKVKTAVGVKSAHRLVMLTWRPIPNAEDLTVDHLDHNKRNNLVTNLEWVSEAENLRRAKKDLIIINTPVVKTWKICFKCGGQRRYFDDVESAANYLMQLKAWKNDKAIVDEKLRTKEYVIQQIEKKAKAGGRYYGTWSIVFRQKRRVKVYATCKSTYC